MTAMIFQVSDLATKRVEFLNAARGGRARLRDTDGTSFVMLPESRLQMLETLAQASQAVMRLEALLRRDELPTITELGDLAWLRPFGREDLREFLDELNEVLISAYADENAAVVIECLSAWRMTAQQLEDPLRKAILTGHHDPADYVEADRPDDDRE